jgi:hypothetical protein
MKRRVFFLLFANLVLADFDRALAGEIFQWVDSRGIIHFTDDYARIPVDVRGTPDLIVRHAFAESDQKPPSVHAEKSEAGIPPTEPHYDRLGEKDAYDEVMEKYSPDTSADAGASDNVTIVVVNNSVHKKRCHGHACSGRFQPNFNDRQHIHPDVFNGGTRQYIQQGAFNGRSRLYTQPRSVPGRK